MYDGPSSCQDCLPWPGREGIVNGWSARLRSLYGANRAPSFALGGLCELRRASWSIGVLEWRSSGVGFGVRRSGNVVTPLAHSILSHPRTLRLRSGQTSTITTTNTLLRRPFRRCQRSTAPRWCVAGTFRPPVPPRHCEEAPADEAIPSAVRSTPLLHHSITPGRWRGSTGRRRVVGEGEGGPYP
jgi:hypothetical protein